MVDPLTLAQQRVLEALRRRADHGESAPTYRELCAEFGWASTGTVRDHLRALARKGYVNLGGGHRQLRLRENRPAVVHVPLVGRVVAGVPVVSDQNVEQRVPVPAEWTRRGAVFALRVTGDSMRDAGIFEGDQVIVRQQSDANDGDIVVATIDGETTLKRLRRNGKRTTLVAENSRYRAIEVRTESEVVQGVVVGLMRLYQDGGGRGRKQVRRSIQLPASKGNGL